MLLATRSWLPEGRHPSCSLRLLALASPRTMSALARLSVPQFSCPCRDWCLRHVSIDAYPTYMVAAVSRPQLLHLLPCYSIFASGATVEEPDGKKVGGGAIELWEAIFLFCSHLVYCTIMYYGETIEEQVKAFAKGKLPRVQNKSDAQGEDAQRELRNVPAGSCRRALQNTTSDVTRPPPTTLRGQNPKT